MASTTKKSSTGSTKKTATKSAVKAGPRIKASHGTPARIGRGAPKAPALKPKPVKDGPPASKKSPLAAPKRTAPRKSLPPAPSGIEASPEARELALALAAAGIDKKAIGIEILDVAGKVDYADFLVVMTGRSDRHVHAIALGLEEHLKRTKGMHALSVEGLSAASWVLIDFGDVVVHVFQEDARAMYDIEGLWIDASRLPVPEVEAPASLRS